MASDSDTCNQVLHKTQYAVGVMRYIFCIAAIIANSVTLVGIRKIKSKFSGQLVLVISLCVTDLLMGLGELILQIKFNSLMGLLGPDVDVVALMDALSCGRNILWNFSLVFYIVSVLNITAMAVEHYIGIAKADYHERFCSRNKIYVAIGVIWIFAVAFVGLTHLVDFLLSGSEPWTCATTEFYNDGTLWVMSSTVCLAAITAAIILVAYVQIYRTTRKSRTSIDNPEETSRLNHGAAVTTLWIIATFSVSWIPLQIFWLLQNYSGYKDACELNVIVSIVSLLPIANTICDPIIYALRVKKIKDGIREACCCKTSEDREENDLGMLMTK